MAWGSAQDLLDPTVARVIELVRRAIACGEDIPTFRRQPEQGAFSDIWAVGDHEVAGLRREGDLLIDALFLPDLRYRERMVDQWYSPGYRPHSPRRTRVVVDARTRRAARDV